MCFTKKEEAVMRVLFKLAGWAGKAYVYPSQRKIVKLCGKWFTVSMSRRTLNRVLAGLEAENYLNRVRRHRRGATGKMEFHSTLYKMSGRAFNWAYGWGAWAGRVFEVFRVPKMAQYKRPTSARYLHPVDEPVKSERPLEEGAARSGPIVLQFKTV